MSTTFRCFSRIAKRLTTFRNYCSKLENTSFYTKPYINFDIFFQNLEALKYNLKCRNILNDVDLDNLKSLWTVLKKHFVQRQNLSDVKLNLEARIKDLKAKKGSEDVDNYERQLIEVSAELENLSHYFDILESRIIPTCLKFPTDLHSETPLTDPVTKYANVLSGELKTNTHHLVIGSKLDLVEYKNPIIFFLTDDAAVFELAVMTFFRQELDKRNFTEFCNPGIVRSRTVEGCGYDFNDPYETFILEGEPREHLVGGASLFPFCGYRARMSNNIKYVPERIFCAGRQYIPPSDEGHDGLYTVVQRSAVQIFVSSKNYEEMIQEFENFLKTVTDIYDSINLTYRVVYAPSHRLKQCEALRANIELYSPFNEKYFEIGNISIYNDYISKRLLMYYHKITEYEFIFFFSGSLINVPTLLACLLEYSENKTHLVIPDCIRTCMLEKGIS